MFWTMLAHQPLKLFYRTDIKWLLKILLFRIHINKRIMWRIIPGQSL